MEHQTHRDRLRLRRSEAELWVLVGQIQHASRERQLGVADAAVVHHDRVADDGGAQGIAVPCDGGSRVGDGQVRQGRRARRV